MTTNKTSDNNRVRALRQAIAGQKPYEIYADRIAHIAYYPPGQYVSREVERWPGHALLVWCYGTREANRAYIRTMATRWRRVAESITHINNRPELTGQSEIGRHQGNGQEITWYLITWHQFSQLNLL